MEEKPLISVIIPCYNAEHYLSEALESLTYQNFEYWECIVIDDGSIDDSQKIAQSWCAKDKRYKYFHQQNAGVVSSRNYGISKASSQLIIPLDADDKLAKDFLYIAYNELMQNKYDVVYGIVECFGALIQRWDKDIFSVKELLIHNLIPVTALYRRQIWEQLNGYKQTMSKGFEDWEFWISAVEKGFKIKQLQFTMLYYRQLPNSRSLQISATDMYNLRKQIALNHIHLYVEHLGDPLNLSYEIKEHDRKYELLCNSWAFKLGTLILSPFKLVQKLMRK
jgi:glycosyltransferase involved in cell wall biosynthesis